MPVLRKCKRNGNTNPSLSISAGTSRVKVGPKPFIGLAQVTDQVGYHDLAANRPTRLTCMFVPETKPLGPAVPVYST